MACYLETKGLKDANFKQAEINISGFRFSTWLTKLGREVGNHTGKSCSFESKENSKHNLCESNDILSQLLRAEILGMKNIAYSCAQIAEKAYLQTIFDFFYHFHG